MDGRQEIELCGECREGPRGIDGHGSLVFDPLTSRMVLFRCASCGCLWSRSYAGEGLFDWTPGVTPHGAR